MVATRRSYAGGAKAAALTAPISAISATLICDALLGWPTGSLGNFAACINRGEANEEKILCSASSGGNLTVVQRGYDSTSPSAHGSGETVEHVFTSIDADEANQHNSAVYGHGIPSTDRLVGEQATQVLTGKTIDGDLNTLLNIDLASSPETLGRIVAIELVNTTQTNDIDALPTFGEVNALIAPVAAAVTAGDTVRYTKTESDARYPLITQTYTKTEVDALFTAHLAALHADTGWIVALTGFTAATGFSLQAIKYRVLGKVVYLSAAMTRTGADLVNTLAGNPANTVLLSGIAAAVTPAQDQGFSSAGDDTTLSSRDIVGTVTASGTVVLTAMGGTSDLTTGTRVLFSAVYFKD
jgi:hypothetical protein